jgi:hypothetical protein
MKGRSLFVCLFIGTQLFFIGFKINQHTQFIAQNYTEQRMKKHQEKLRNEKNRLMCILHALNSQGVVKKYAEQYLGLKAVKISKVRTIHDGYRA